MEKQERKSNLELLRIISMILIILHHFGYHGNYTPNSLIDKFFMDFTILGGKVGVTIFILITGYFMIENKWNVKKLIKIILETVFYSIGIAVIFQIFGFTKLDLRKIILFLTPTIHSNYWFVTTYVLLYLFIPYINKLLKNLSKEEYKKFMLLILVIQYIISRIFYINNLLSSLSIFILIYAIGAYIKLYPNAYFENMKRNRMITLLSYLLLFLVVIILDCISIKFNISNYKMKVTYLVDLNSILVLITSVHLFLWFLKLDIKQNKIINTIAKSTFGIYIIHEHIFIKKLVWNNIFKIINITATWQLVILAIVSTILIFVVCLIIDQMRINTIGKLEDKIIKKFIK